jgi:purine-cytosine permease-like protein
MGLLWVTMVTGFPSVLAGFEWFHAGMSLPQVVFLSIVSCGVLLLYSFSACYLGAKSGLTYALLARKVFGVWGSRLVSANLCWISLSWYGLTAVFLADGLNDVFHTHIPKLAFSLVLAVMMAFNNFFGFSGVANFARYAAGPILILWVLSAFGKAATTCPSSVWSEPSHAPMLGALTIVSAFVIGYSSWGNEADYWRFGRRAKRNILIPLLVSLLIGEILFPLTGWMFGRMGGNSATASGLMDNFAFGGFPIISAIVLFVTYFAVNDSTLYGAINALDNIHTMNRRRTTAFLTITGAVAAGVLCGMSKNFERVCSISCIVLPCATVVIMVEQFLLAHRFGEVNADKWRWSAVLALLIGCVVGIATAGIIPGTESWNIGVPALQAWLAALVAYLCLHKMDRYTVAPLLASGETDDNAHQEPEPTSVGIHDSAANRS